MHGAAERGTKRNQRQEAMDVSPEEHSTALPVLLTAQNIRVSCFLNALRHPLTAQPTHDWREGEQQINKVQDLG